MTHVPTGKPNLVLAYQGAEASRRESNERLWGSVAEVLAFSVVWGVVVAVAAALLGSVLLWGVLLTAVAR